MKDSAYAPLVFGVLLTLVVVTIGFDQIRRAEAITQACREACFPFIHKQVEGECFCYTPEGDLKRPETRR